MTQSNTAPAGAATLRPCAEGTRDRAPRRAAARFAAVLGLGLAANFVVADVALGPANAIVRPPPDRVGALSPAPTAVSVPTPREADLLGPIHATRAGLRAGRRTLGTHLDASEIRAHAGRIAAAFPTAQPRFGWLVRSLERALAREQQTVRYGDMRVARWIVTAVEAAAARTGTDPVFMLALADKESSLRPGVGASTSSAEGLYQFIEQTWLAVLYEFGPEHGLAEAAADIVRSSDGTYAVADADRREEILGLRGDPLVAGLMAGEMLTRDRARLEETLGRRIAPHEVYIAHFLGPGGAERFLALKDESPKADAAKAFAAAARANRGIFYERGRRGRALSVEEVDHAIAGMIGTRVDRYTDVDPQSESARARRIARLLAASAASYASLKTEPDVAVADDVEAAPGDGTRADLVLRIAEIVGGDAGATIPLPPRRPLNG